jgi:purine-binding chemotaxis protein CheW
VVFEAGGELYAVDGGAVREIVPVAACTRIPGAPAHVMGLMNLRGTLLVVLDLVHRMAGHPVMSEEASIAVVQSGGRQLGIAVDDVLDVTDLTPGELEQTPPPLDRTLARGLGHFAGRVVIVIDVHELVRQTLA